MIQKESLIQTVHTFVKKAREKGFDDELIKIAYIICGSVQVAEAGLSMEEALNKAIAFVEECVSDTLFLDKLVSLA